MFRFFKQLPKSIKDQKGLRIVVFHGITEDDPHKFNSRFISKQLFEQLVLLLKQHCNLISFTDLLEKNISSSKLNVLITFDDGYKNNFDYAFPFLVKHNVPAIFFVTTRHTSQLPYLFNDIVDISPVYGKEKVLVNNEEFYRKKIFLNYRYVNKSNEQLAKKYHHARLKSRNGVLEQLSLTNTIIAYKSNTCFFELMTDSMIKTLSKNKLFTIGSHTKNHLSLATLNRDELEEEIIDSINHLKHVSGQTEIPFAFPYGEYSEEVLNVCLKHQIKNLFGTELLLNESHKNLIENRFQINPFITPILQLHYVAKGKYE